MKKLLLKAFMLLCLIAWGGVSSAWAAIEDGTYELCTSTSDLVAGEHYIIASGNSGSVQCISNESNSNNRKQVAATVANNQIVVASNSTIMTFTLGGSTDAWTFSTDNYAGTNGYLASAASGNNNYCRVIETSTTSTVSISNNAAVITLQPHTSRNILRYNSSSSCFACYSSGQGAVYLYKKVTSGDPVDASWSVSPASVSVRATKTANATITTNYNGTLSVASNNSSVATATINGKVITVTGVAEGTTTLTVTGTATSKYNAVSKTINVTVTPNITTPGTYSITPNNAFWGTSYSGIISSVKANSLTLNGESDDISVQLKNGSSTNGYVNDEQTRVYNGYTMKFNVPTGFDITAIAFTAGDAWAGTHTASVGTMNNNKNWTGAANEVTINFKGTCQINGISVTYAVHVAPTVTYTVTFNAGTNGSCATSELTETSYGAGVTLPEATPNARYDFVGWSTSSTPTSANAGVAGNTYYPTANCTLYAYYTKQIPTFSGAYIDFDLSTDNTTTATDNEMTWTNSVLNIATVKGSGEKDTPANNYYPGSSTPRTSTRFYANSTLTFTPTTGVTITGIEFTTTTELFATEFANSTWTNGDAAADAANKIAYVTPNDGTQPVSATIGATTGGTKFRVYFTGGSTSLSVSDAGYSTLYLDYAATIPTGVQAFTGVLEGNKLTMTELSSTIPAKTAVVLKAAEASYTFEATAYATFSGSNDLKGCLIPTATSTIGGGTVCTLAKVDEVVGFYWFKGSTLGANKAYLVVPENLARVTMSFEDEESAIETVEVEKQNNDMFDLMGRRTNNKTGLRIVNGKKVMLME